VTRRPDILFVLPDLAGGGAQRVMLRLAGSLDRARFSPRLVVLGGAETLAGELPAGVPAERWGAPRLRSALPRLVSHIRQSRPAVVVSVMGYLNLALLAARPLLPRATRLVVREANMVAPTLAVLPRPLRGAWVYRRLYGRADLVVAPSETIAADLLAAAPGLAERLLVLPNPVDVDGLRARAATPRRVPGEGPRFVAAGRLSRQKGFDRLIDLVAEAGVPGRVEVFGEGPDRDALVAEAAAKGLSDRIVFPGFTGDLPAHLAGADAFLMPSRWEGLPNAALEALALGTPVIATPESNVAELMARAPAGAVAVAPTGPDFAAAMMAVRPDPVTMPRPSLLPDVYRRDAVAAAFAARLEGLLGSP